MIKDFSKFNESKNIGKVVFTGVAGAGKTTILDEFEKIGYKVVDESARKLIKYYQENDQSKLPWNNRELFQSIVENDQLQKYLNNDNCIFDRCMVDEIAYRRYNGMEVSENLKETISTHRYDKVFIFPFWKDIYKQDSERTETPEEAEALFNYLMKGYTESGYNPIIVPTGPIEYRTEFIIDRLD